MSYMRLINGDCLVEMNQIPSESIPLILSDLPYGCGKTANDWDKELDLKALWEQYERIITSNGVICLFGSEPFTSKLIQSNPKLFRYKMIWEKEGPTGFLNCNYKPLQQFEDIIIFSKGTIGSLSKNPIRYFPQGLIPINKEKKNNPNSTWRKNKGYSATTNKLNSNSAYVQKYTNYPNDILKFRRDKNAIHATQKPVALLEYLIKTYTIEGECVLDSCAGSFSTGRACLNTNRNFIGIELNRQIFNQGKDSLEDAMKIKNKKDIE